MKLSKQSRQIIDQLADNVSHFSSADFGSVYGGSFSTSATANALKAIAALKKAAVSGSAKDVAEQLDSVEASIQSLVTLSAANPVLQAQTNPSKIAPTELDPLLAAMDSVREELETGKPASGVEEVANKLEVALEKRQWSPVYLLLVFAIVTGIIVRFLLFLYN